MKWARFAIIPLAAVLAIGVLYLSHRIGTTNAAAQVPDFAAIKDVSVKKKRFVEFMLPIVRRANTKVRKERQAVKRLSKRVAEGHTLGGADHRTLSHLLSKYKVKNSDSTSTALSQLLKRVDAIPASLMLAQSATESAWGASRFAREGNNFFGIWCFTPACGITPKRRDEGLTHEVARFDSVQQSADQYLLAINTNLAYSDLRQIRASEREHNKPLRGIKLAQGLQNYSERGSDYVHYVEDMIRSNNLQRFTAGRSTAKRSTSQGATVNRSQQASTAAPMPVSDSN